MKNILFITFDLIRPGEPSKSLAIGSILAYLKHRPGKTYTGKADHLSINMLNLEGKSRPADFYAELSKYELNEYDYIALSAYIWNEYLINPFISFLRELGFRNKIVLGGYQIAYTSKPELQTTYPDCQHFIIGYAEASTDLLCRQKGTELPLFLETAVDFYEIPSPYITGEIGVSGNTTMLRMETKRGCPYRCSFCAHRDLVKKKVSCFHHNKVNDELEFLSIAGVERVNVLDPIFNAGSEYLSVMNKIATSCIQTRFNIQTRFENIKGSEGQQFLEFCTSGNFYLEFGLQTANRKESETIKRANNIDQIKAVLKTLASYKIGFEVSLIYGLPGQTLSSFRESIAFLQDFGCGNIKAYPLMLLKGTSLYADKKQWEMKEEVMGGFNIPVVTSSNSFTRADWLKMDEIANELMTTERI